MKNLAKLIGILLILLAFAIFLKRSRERIPQKALLSNFDPEKIESIKVKNKNVDLQLAKKNNIWLIERPIQANADTNSIEELLNKLKNVIVGEVITEDKNKYDYYEVNETSGTLLTINFKDKKTVSIIFGKESSNQSLFLKYPDKNQVYTASGLEKYILDKEPNLWRDRTILKFKNEDLNVVILQKKDGFEVIKSSDQWILNIAKKQYDVDSNKLTDFLNQLSNFNADDFYAESSTASLKITGLNEPVLKLKLKFNNGDEKEIFFGKQDSQSRIYVAQKDMSQVFLVYNYTFANINKKYSDLIKQTQEK